MVKSVPPPASNNDLDDRVMNHNEAYLLARPATPQMIQAEGSANRVAQISADLDRILPPRPSTAASRVQSLLTEMVAAKPPPVPGGVRSLPADSNSVLKVIRLHACGTVHAELNASCFQASVKEDALLSILTAQTTVSCVRVFVHQ